MTSNMRMQNFPLRQMPLRACWILALLPVPAVLFGCNERLPNAATSQSAEGPSTESHRPWFRECAAEVGLNFRHNSGHQDERFLIPEIVAGGAAVVDVDNDGWLDIYFVQSAGLASSPSSNAGNRLYHNRGDGTFEDISAQSGASDDRYGVGVAAGDYDNDGFIDLYVTNSGRNTLLRNNGDRTFADVTEAAGVGHTGMGSSAAFVDFDHDGHLDLFVCNYLNWTPESELDCFNSMGGRDYCSPQNYAAPARHVLYHNRGNGTFDDVSETSCISSEAGTGLGVVCADFNADDWIDIFVANDGMANLLWQSQGDGSFANVALQAGCAFDVEGVPKAGMGTDSADINNDGWPDRIVGTLRGQSDSLFIIVGA
jgi:hypothetical protein